MSEPGHVARLRLDELLTRAQRDGRLPSLVAGLARDGRLVWTGGAGEVPGQVADTQYRIGSITKSLTAVLVLQAVRDGLMELGAPLSSYVEEAPFADRTVHDVLSHASGMAAEPVGPWWERRSGGSFADLARANAQARALAGPGEEFLYSNLGYGLLGEAVARVHRRSWRDLVGERVLAPLGMTRTSYLPEGGAATGYSVHHLLSTLTPEPESDTGAMAPAGQLWSTLTDLATWSGFLLDGHPDVLEPALVAQMAAPAAPGGTYGLGLQLVDGGRLVGHTGTMPGFMAKVQVDRAARTAALALANGTVGLDPDGLTGRMLAVLGTPEPAAVAAWRPATEVPEDVPRLVGTWWWGHRPHELVWSSGELVLRSLVARTVGDAQLERFTRRGDGWVDSLGAPLEVVRRDDGSVAWFCFDTYLFTRTPYDAESPVPGGAP